MSKKFKNKIVSCPVVLNIDDYEKRMGDNNQYNVVNNSPAAQTAVVERVHVQVTAKCQDTKINHEAGDVPTVEEKSPPDERKKDRIISKV